MEGDSKDSKTLAYDTAIVLERSGHVHSSKAAEVEDPDVEFGGSEERRTLERKLLWKLDCRMSIMIIIYILNYVSFRIYLSMNSTFP